ncbi:MAG: hypothetical protein ABII82_14635 [Verrucomicrobiota bacterium]
MPAKATPQEWDHVRAAFASSLMVDLPLSSLAQNLEGPDWPIKGATETPATYIDLPYDEALDMLSLKGLGPGHLDKLIGILQETLSFDEPFGEMVNQNAAAAERENPVRRNLARAGIPESHPLALCELSPDIREFCQLEKITTLGEFALFTQEMSQNVIVGGDFRALLNALSHFDENVLARHLPYRVGASGLHLIEAIAHAVRPLSPETRAAIAADPGSTPVVVLARIDQCAAHFTEQAAAITAQLAAGTPAGRVAAVLDDPGIEPAVAALIRHRLAPPPAAPAAKKSWFTKLLGR